LWAKLFSAVLVHKKASPSGVIRYAQENSIRLPDREATVQLGRRIPANVMDEDEQTALVRHNPQRLAGVLQVV